MRLIIIPTLIIMLFFYPSAYLPISTGPLDQKYPEGDQRKPACTYRLSDQPLAWADDTPNVEVRDYCSDPDLKLQWEFLISKYPEDMGLQALHALRLGLCFKVERNDISLEDALKIFEDVKKSFVEKKLDELLEDSNEQDKDR